MSEKIEDTLAQRGKTYGEFPGHARITQGLKDVMRAEDNWEKLAPDQKEALEMVAHKIGRILNGDVNFRDSWWDQIGYLQLVVNRLDKEIEDKKSTPIFDDDDISF